MVTPCVGLKRLSRPFPYHPYETNDRRLDCRESCEFARSCRYGRV